MVKELISFKGSKKGFPFFVKADWGLTSGAFKTKKEADDLITGSIFTRDEPKRTKVYDRRSREFKDLFREV